MRPTWEEYFMTNAKLAAMRSQDPVTKVGCVIVDTENKLISMGYNGMPRSVDFTWEKGHDLNNKNLFVVHSEVNAILNAKQSVKGSTIYVTLFPCNECAKIIAQSGIKRVVYLSDKYHDKLATQASRMILEACGVEVVAYTGAEFEIVKKGADTND